MNHFFIESRAKERVNEVMDEGLRSQAIARSGAPKRASVLPKLILILIGILGALELLVR